MAIIAPLTNANQDQYKRFKQEPPKGVLFYGPPGTGKTRLALALRNELRQVWGKPVHFIYRKGNDVASMYFGKSSENLRKIFKEAIRMKPTVLFFDELDGLCPSRDKWNMSQAQVSIVTTMLGLIDEAPRGEVFIIGASNMMDSIDPALRRPGRFDKYLEFLPPSEEGRNHILLVHTEKWKVKPNPEVLHELTLRTVGFTGADLSKLCLDAFDRALSRVLFDQSDTAESYSQVDFENLAVEAGDWKLALDKMKPSVAHVFGSTMYTPTLTVADHIQPLLQTNIAYLQHMVRELLPRAEDVTVTATDGKLGQIPVIYIWSDSKSLFENMEDFVISPLFRSSTDLSDIPKYYLSSDILTSLPIQNWPMKVDSAFSQAVGCYQPSILYVPNVSELWTTMKHSSLGEVISLEKNLETLRGSRVLLVTTGTSHPLNLECDNPFKQVCCSTGSIHKVIGPSVEERAAFFGILQISKDVLRDWTDQQRKYAQTITSKFVVLTEGLGAGMIVGIFDNLQNRLSSPSIRNAIDVLTTMAEVYAATEMQLAAIRGGDRDSMDIADQN